ncbi:MAG: pentapeptide repeat-containing protein, partial [Chloroflexota bacterium]|nr:pentapeptide repeat-containing protein [Chloroflexota bacterium]
TDLRGAFLNEAHLEGAFLNEAHLERADLRRAHLEGVDLRHVVGLTPEQLQQAITDEETQIPDYLKTPLKEKAVGQPSGVDVAGKQ